MRILITDGIDKCAVASALDAGYEIIEQFIGEEELGEALQAFDAVIIGSATNIRGYHIDEATEGELQLIICLQDAVENVDAWYAEKNGIAVRSIAPDQTSPVAEIVSILTSFFIKGDSLCQL